MKKLRSKRGETLIESMASLMIVILIISMLPVSIETAARINAKAKKMETLCQRTMSEEAQTTVEVYLYSKAADVELEQIDVQGYSENGFVYYVGK